VFKPERDKIVGDLGHGLADAPREAVEGWGVLGDFWAVHRVSIAPISEQSLHDYLTESSSDMGATNTKNIVGPRVQQIRLAKGMTQDAFTAECNLVGLNISRGTLAKIESQVRRVMDSEIVLLAKALRVDVSELYKKGKIA
jgi:DNA-binding XRE family transcriptional regulator